MDLSPDFDAKWASPELIEDQSTALQVGLVLCFGLANHTLRCGYDLPKQNERAHDDSQAAEENFDGPFHGYLPDVE